MIRVSVVMTTYNGEKFIKEQLDSINQQTLKPDEVLIFDDQSTDNTVKIIQDYIEKKFLSNWKITVNIHNLGWKKNFVQAIKEAKGDIIFLSDQDDIWMPTKIDEMVRTMEENHNIKVLVGNSVNFYSSDNNTKLPPFYSFKNHSFYLNKIWMNKGLISRVNKIIKDEKKNTGEIIKIKFDDGLISNQRQGCVMAIRNDIVQEALNKWNENCPHDTVLWFYAACKDGLYLYEKNVIKYRHHVSNTGFRDTLGEGLTSKSEIKKIDDQLKQLDYLKHVMNSSCMDSDSADEKYEVFLKIQDYLKLRKTFLQKHRMKDGFAIIKRKGNASKRQVIFDWLLAYLT